jgi:hypothetical protein
MMVLPFTGDDDVVGLVAVRSAHALHVDVMIVFKTRHPVEDFHSVARELGLGHVDLGLDDVLHAKGKIGHSDLFLYAIIHPVDRAVVVAREMQHRFAHRLAGDGAGVDAHAAHNAPHLDERHMLALLDRGNSRALPGRARTDDEQIVFRHVR